MGFGSPGFGSCRVSIFGSGWDGTTASRLGEQSVLKEQEAAMTMGPFAQLGLVHQSHSFWSLKALFMVTHTLVTSQLDYCSTVGSYGFSLLYHKILQPCELYWLLVGFWVWFKIMVTLEIGLGYLTDLLPRTLASPICSPRGFGILRHLGSFSVVALAFWNDLSPIYSCPQFSLPLGKPLRLGPSPWY